MFFSPRKNHLKERVKAIRHYNDELWRDHQIHRADWLNTRADERNEPQHKELRPSK